MSNNHHTDLVRLLRHLDSLPVREYYNYIMQYEDSVASLGKHFFADSHYQWRYVVSLFEQGHYRKFLNHVDETLGYLLSNPDWEDAAKYEYNAILYKKAAAHAQIKEYDKARKICNQLEKLNYNRTEISFLRTRMIRNRTMDIFFLLHNRNTYIFLSMLLVAGLVFLMRTLLFQ